MNGLMNTRPELFLFSNVHHLTQTDESFLAAALREANEEIGLSAEQVEILGVIGPPKLSLGGLRVWPHVVS